MIFYIKCVVVSITLLYLLSWLYVHYLKPTLERKRLWRELYTPHIQQCHQLLSQLYKAVNAFAVAKAARKQMGLNDHAFVYGEIDTIAFSQILKFVDPKPEQIFYDLGCGSGLAVFAAALSYPMKKCIGVELLHPLFHLCEQQLAHFQTLTAESQYFANHPYAIEFYHQDLLTVDISDGDIIFINATGFFGELWQQITQHLFSLQSGAKVIITSKKLPETHFQLLDDRPRLMSWGMSTVKIYQKI